MFLRSRIPMVPACSRPSRVARLWLAPEGVWAKAGKRRSRLEDAVNSARETLMALKQARACGYLPEAEALAAVRRRRCVIAVLWVLAYRR